MKNEEIKLEKIVANLVQKVDQRFYGKYRGFVKDNNDPEKLGRLKVTVPSVLGDKIAVWAFPCSPYGGNADRGFLFIPEKEAGVWVEFEEGDPEFPIWVGTFWSKPGGKSELPKPNQADGSQEGLQAPPTCKIIKTQKGHTIQMEDADDKETVIIVEAKNKHYMVMDKDGITVKEGIRAHTVVMDKDGIKVTDGANNHEITMNKDGIVVTDGANKQEILMNKDGVKVTDKKKNVIEMQESSFNITSKVPFKIDASGQAVTIIGSTIDLNKG